MTTAPGRTAGAVGELRPVRGNITEAPTFQPTSPFARKLDGILSFLQSLASLEKRRSTALSKGYPVDGWEPTASEVVSCVAIRRCSLVGVSVLTSNEPGMTSFDLAAGTTEPGIVARGCRLCCRGMQPTSRLFVAAGLSALLTFPPTSEAQVSVGDGGTPGYSMPVAVPPGIAGMSPKLGLLYSGAGVNGPVGLGWSIQGLSSVTRCSPSYAIDGMRRGVGYVASDKLCLDGQRLVQTAAAGTPLTFPQTNDAQGLGSGQFREYRTEKDSYARVRAFGYANGDATGASGPAYFRVWTKAGQVYEYGAGPSADGNTKALVNAQGTSVPMVWAVSRISDTLGNFIDFKYEQRDSLWGSGPVAGTPTPGREWNLLEIQYSGNKVVFGYADRPAQQPQDAGEAYHQGAKNISRRLLQGITTYINSPNITVTGPAGGAVAVKTTKLTYDSGPITKRSRVVNIQECAGGATSVKCLPATKFSYAAGGNDAFQASALFSASSLAALKMQDSAGKSGVLLGDFDGDGKSDILYWSDNPAQNALYLSNGDGTFRLVPAGTGAGQFNITDQNLFKSGQCNYTLVADFNGDGITDLLRYSPSGCSGGAPTYLYLGKGDGSFNRITVTTLPTLTSFMSLDVFNCIRYDSISHACLETGINRGWTAGSSFYLLDVNGDGRLDVITTVLPAQQPEATRFPAATSDACLSTTCTRVFLGDGVGGFTEVSTNLANKSVYSDQSANRFRPGRVNYVADFNGDGLGDLIGISTYFFQAAAAWLSRGDGNFDPVVQASHFDCFLPLDFNGDRKPDCLRPGSTASSNSLSVGAGGATLSNVAGFNLTQTGQELQTLSATTFALTAGTQLIDINGDGRTDLLRWTDDPSQNTVYISNGDGTFTQSATFNLGGGSPVQLQKSDDTASFFTGDFTGRGTTEILRLQTVGSVVSNQLFLRSDPTPADQLVSATSASGATTTLFYVPLSNSLPSNGVSAAVGARYSSDRDLALPATPNKIDLSFPIYVVATSAADSGLGSSTINTEYSYLGLKADTGGRGLLGFREVRRQSPGPNGQPLTVATQYLSDQPYIGVASRTDTYLGALNTTASGQKLSSTLNVYCDKTAAPGAHTAALGSGLACPTSSKVQRPYLLKTTETGKDLGNVALPSVVTQNTYSASGDPTQIVSTTSGTTIVGVPQSFTRSTVNQYQPDNTACADYQTCAWVLGRLTQTTVTSTVPNSLSSIPTVAGSGINASATQGSSPLQVAVLTPALNFGAVVVGASSTLTVTLANGGAATLGVTVPGASSVTGADFSFVSTTCTTSLAIGSNCTVTLKVAPTAVGTRSGTLTIVSAAGSLSSSLSATGSAPSVAIIPAWSNWGTVGAGSDSGDWPTIRNNSTVPIIVTGHSVASGPAGVWAWQGIADPAYCQPGITVLAPGTSCLSFFGVGTLATPGAYTAVERVSFQAKGVPASTFNVQQTFGFSMATTAPSPPSLAFGNVSYNASAALGVTLNNGADQVFENLTLSIDGANAAKFSVASNACGTSVPAHGSCVLSLNFTPGGVASGLQGSLNASGVYARYTASGKQAYYPNPQAFNVGLSGNGYGSVATLMSAASLTVPATWYASAAQTVAATYRNDGNAPMTLATPALTAPLSITSNNCSGVAPGGSCSMVVTATTYLAGIGQSQILAPTGSGIAPPATIVTWTTFAVVPRWAPTSLAFGNVVFGSPATQNITLYNDGNVAYDWATNSSIANAPGGYSFNTTACSNVAPGGSCNIAVTFAPPGTATYAGSNLSMSSASFSTNTFSVSGTGIGPFAFMSVSASVSSASAVLTYTFRNNNSIALPLTARTLTDQGASNSLAIFTGGTCIVGASVAPAATCTVVVRGLRDCPSAYSVGVNVSNAAGVSVGPPYSVPPLCQ